jgi:cyclophilin family peptidyl-prolyl cis-trans isomerase
MAIGPAFGQTEGLFADFSTSKGAFTVWLDHERAPRAVASFVGLATGETSWADPQGNVWRKPFYAGSLFHRVVKNGANGIAIQGGGFATVSGSTTNFANSGYYMMESVTNGLAHSNGVISMANSGPNTDGSQFFITATNVQAWNGSYTVFGHVTTGMDAVASIAAVAVQGVGERPVEDVVLSNVVIRRVGAAAANFNIASQGVPMVESGPMSATTSGTNVILKIEIANQSGMQFRESADLQTWESANLGLSTNATTIWTTSVPRVALSNAYFFHASRIRYSLPITSPPTPRARKFTFWWNVAPAVKYEATFAANPVVQGDFVVTSGTNAPLAGTVYVGDTWTREPHGARLYFMDGTLREYSYSLGFNPGQTTNRFTGTWWNFGSAVRNPISGVFTVQ